MARAGLARVPSRLGLEGGVDQEQFTQILRGQSPDGAVLFSRKLDQKTATGGD